MREQDEPVCESREHREPNSFDLCRVRVREARCNIRLNVQSLIACPPMELITDPVLRERQVPGMCTVRACEAVCEKQRLRGGKKGRRHNKVDVAHRPELRLRVIHGRGSALQDDQRDVVLRKEFNQLLLRTEDPHELDDCPVAAPFRVVMRARAPYNKPRYSLVLRLPKDLVPVRTLIKLRFRAVQCILNSVQKCFFCCTKAVSSHLSEQNVKLK